MNEEQLKEAVKFVEERYQNCPLCDSGNKHIGNSLVFMPILKGKKIQREEGRAFIVVTCMDCDHSTFFDAAKSGL